MKIKRNSFWLKQYRRFNLKNPNNMCQYVLFNTFFSLGAIVLSALVVFSISWIYYALGFIGLDALSQLDLIEGLKSKEAIDLYGKELFSNNPVYFFGSSLLGMAYVFGISMSILGVMYVLYRIVGFLIDLGESIFKKINTLQNKHCSKVEIED